MSDRRGHETALCSESSSGSGRINTSRTKNTLLNGVTVLLIAIIVILIVVVVVVFAAAIVVVTGDGTVFVVVLLIHSYPVFLCVLQGWACSARRAFIWTIRERP